MPPSKKLKAGELEELLADMEHYKQKKDRFTKLYEQTRDQITPHLKDPAAFVNEAGEKMYAVPVRAENIVFDVEELAELVDEDTFAEIIKVDVDRDAFRRAVASERIAPAVVAKVTKLVPKATSIRFSSEPPKGEDEMTVDFPDE